MTFLSLVSEVITESHGLAGIAADHEAGRHHGIFRPVSHHCLGARWHVCSLIDVELVGYSLIKLNIHLLLHLLKRFLLRYRWSFLIAGAFSIAFGIIVEF